jgi:hypothetical protein
MEQYFLRDLILQFQILQQFPLSQFFIEHVPTH